MLFGAERLNLRLALGSGVHLRPAALTLGLASYSFREFPLDQALEMAKTVGVTHMTFKDVHLPRTDSPEATRALRAKIEAAGITIMGGGTITIPNNPVQIAKEFVYAKNAGFPLIYVDPEPAALDTLEQLAKSHDIKVAIHNHGPEDKRWPRPQDAYAAIRSRETSEDFMPWWPIAMPSVTVIVQNSRGVPLAAATPFFTAWAWRISEILQGAASFQQEATPTSGWWTCSMGLSSRPSASASRPSRTSRTS